MIANDYTLFEKSNFCPKIQLQHFHEFSPNFFWQFFSWNQSCQLLKRAKPQHFHEFFTPKNWQFSRGNQSWIFGQKMKISNSVDYKWPNFLLDITEILSVATKIRRLNVGIPTGMWKMSVFVAQVDLDEWILIGASVTWNNERIDILRLLTHTVSKVIFLCKNWILTKSRKSSNLNFCAKIQ